MELKLILVVCVFLTTGTITTLLTKFSNTQTSVGKDGEERLFKHPFLQCWGLSVGEASCILLFIAWNSITDIRQKSKGAEAKERTKFNPLIFVPPSILHLTSRVLCFIGLTFTTASSFQMLSGSNLIFVCIFSRIFLKKALPWYKWFGVFLNIMGVVIVGVGDMLVEEGGDINSKDLITGDILVVVGMLFWGIQMTYEEKFVKKYNIKPTNAIGLEGSFALIILSIMLVVLYFIPVKMDMGQPDGQLEDAIDGFVQLGNNPKLLVSFIFTTLALCVSLITGIDLTKKLSAVHRLIINSGRSITVWVISLAVHWQTFQPLQIVGFLVMMLGVFVFNDILFGPIVRSLLRRFGCMQNRSEDISDKGATKDTELAEKDIPKFDADNPVIVRNYKSLNEDKV